ncbi:phosphoenolpyruvate synthase [Candidatus Sulfidibacterium hydrothermale]|uniref:PEP/pyruvate-binding domain-containing protein n=1 Tax=Candidatus Sulfidibacterium hydrothermale TaxID=2875962 RepID=UPI001F0A9289|nr:PEP/pyruvate-binding domain-containing protein [Candidatus Sulfidibacterium hydrothermale]UBM63289.1 phosphoenolpyruvate synthase [Candidatus Sulfidibacterium hydrothermale]
MIPERTDIYAAKYYFNDASFSLLMRKRIYNILLVSSVYDAFILEEDGRIEEQIFNEYMSLNLRYPPRFIQATSLREAMKYMREEPVDLVISMLSFDDKGTFKLAATVKAEYPRVPVIALSPFSREVSLRIEKLNLSNIDYVFSWLGNTDLLLAIIKLIEDRMNVEHDVKAVGVQTIILVEDNIRFYSSYLPNIYKIIFQQSKAFVTEGLNEHQKMLKARGRPKILLATNYEEGIHLYRKYKNNLLGVISDISYPRKGIKDPEAGLRLFKRIKKENKYMPLLLQSSDPSNEQKAKALGVGFIDKNSSSLPYELRSFIKYYFGFGDFIFKDPETDREVGRAKNLKDLQEKIFQIPKESLRYHIERDHLSKWLRARALFSLAKLFQSFTIDDFENINEVRYFIFNAISNFRISKSRGVISQFDRTTFDEYFSISRIGQGSIGGKARGLAFLDSLINRNKLHHLYDDIDISIPKTVVLGTDIFDEFMEHNDLYPIALSDNYSDEEILQFFLDARLPESVQEDLFTIASLVNQPLAVRSSSLLEDSHYQPFAGIYNTYMIPSSEKNLDKKFELLNQAIKSVYASAFFADSKAYMKATSNVLDEEKMAVVLQEVCGKRYGNYYYPTLSGVARSLDYYPIPPEKPKDGTANIALGLGKYIVDGGLSLRFSPKYPKKVMQTATPDAALRETQKYFYALDLHPEKFVPSTDDSMNLVKLRIKDAEQHGSIRKIASTYDLQNNVIRDGYNYPGKKLITFNSILKHDVFPLAEILQKTLELGAKEMDKPVEIEFVVDLNVKKGEKIKFYLLQIRPIASKEQSVHINVHKINQDKLLILSHSALGNGVIDHVQDVVYVKPQTFDASKNRETAEMIGEINKKFIDKNRNYILIGPGRWGSSDPWLGIPVKWPQISGARLIIESGLENYRIDPSQGTHFFQNLTSFRVGYFTINPYLNDGIFDLDFLDRQKAVFENDTIRHVRFKKPLIIKIDGKKNLGIVLKP